METTECTTKPHIICARQVDECNPLPNGIAIDPEGNIIVTDHLSDRIRKIIAELTPPQVPPQPEAGAYTRPLLRST